MASIDIGAGALDRSAQWGGVYTYIDLTNPANDTGTITSFEVWFWASGEDPTGVVVGTFYGSSTTWTNRDYETLGSVTKGSKQTFSGLNCSVSASDIDGFYATTGSLEGDATGGSGICWKVGSQFGTGLQTGYTPLANYQQSIYGTGTTPVVVPTVETHTPATSITPTTAYVEGHCTADGGATVTDRGICYNTTGTPTTSSDHVHNGSGIGIFNTQLTSLSENTTYHCRAFAINSAGTAYGAEVDFTTGKNCTVSGVLATATAQGYDPTIIAEINVTVSAVLATADSAAGVPEVTAGQGTDSSPPLVEATAESPVPEILAGDCVIAATLATADAQVEAPSIIVEVSFEVPAEVATADASSIEPAIQLDYVIPAEVATATAEMPAPFCEVGVFIDISAPAAVSTAESLAPALLLDQYLFPVSAAEAIAEVPGPAVLAEIYCTVIAEPAAATGEVFAPDITTTSSITITAEVATATASSPAAAVQLGCAIAATTASAIATAPAPTFTSYTSITVIVPTSAIATAEAGSDTISLTVIPHLILAASYSQESQEVSRVFIVGVDSNGAIVTGSAAQEVL